MVSSHRNFCGIFSGMVVRYFETDSAKRIRESAAKDYLRNLSSVGTYPGLKGQVILRCLTNLSESFGEERGMRPKICFSDWTLPRTREGGRKWNCGGRVERLSTPERSKSKRFVISKGCSLMDFLSGLNLKSSVVCITRDGEGKLALSFYAIVWI